MKENNSTAEGSKVCKTENPALGLETTRRTVIKQFSTVPVLFGVGDYFTGTGAAMSDKDDTVEPMDSGTLTNNNLAVFVGSDGLWQIDTADGKNLTYPSAGTSGLTVQIEGTNYTYGSPSGTSLSSYQTQDTQFSSGGAEATTKWDVDGVRITQTIRLSGEAAVFELDVENTTAEDREVKLRWLFDYQVGVQDGAPIFVNGEVLTTETRYNSPSFDSWQTYNQLPGPSLTGQGSVSDTPTKVEFVAWEDAFDSGYEYSGFDPTKAFYTEGFDSSPQSDSAGLLYYDLGAVGSGSLESIRTSYGVGSPDQNRLEDVEQAMENLQDTASDALTTMVEQRARAHAAIYSRVGEEHADNYVNYFGYNAGVDGISQEDVNTEIRQKLDELIGDLEGSQYSHLYEFFDAMFGAVEANADQTTMESVFTNFIEGEAQEQEDGSAPRLQIGGQSITGIRSGFESEFSNRRATALETLEAESPSEAEIERIVDYFEEKATTLNGRAISIEEKVDRAISSISNGETGRIHGKRVEVNDDSAGNDDSTGTQAIGISTGLAYMGFKFAGPYLATLYGTQLVYQATSTGTSTASAVSAAYSGTQLASSLTWSLPSMTYWSVLQSGSTALKSVVKGVVKDQFLQEFGLTPAQLIEEYTGFKVDILLGLTSPVTTLGSMTVDQIQDAGSDLSKTVEIVDIDAPNIGANDVSANGEVTATATVSIENTSSDAITPVLVNSESGIQTEPLLSGFPGPVDLGQTTFETDFPEIPPGETEQGIEVNYTFPVNWLIGFYELKLTVSPADCLGGNGATDADSFLTTNVPDGVSTTQVQDGAISQGSSQQTTYTSQSGTERLTFSLSYPGSNLDLHLYDNSGNHVGVNYESGEFENEIPDVTASGPDRPGLSRESIQVGNPGGEYESEVVAVETDGDEPFNVDGTSVESLPPTLNVYTLTSPTAESGSLADTSITVEESAGFNKLENVTFSATSLENDGGDSISADNVSFGQSGFDIPPSSTETIEVTVDIPSDAVGDYSGEIQVSSAETSFAAPLVVSVDRSLRSSVVGDVNGDGAVTSADAQLILQSSAGGDPNNYFAPAADIDRDGEVTSADAQRALLKSAGGLDEAEITVSNLTAPGSVTAGGTVTLSADLENRGNEGALQNLSVRIAPEGDTLDESDTIDQQFVDMAVPGVSNPVDRPAQTTIRFENVTIDLDPGNYTVGVFSENDDVTAPLEVTLSS